MRLNALIKTGAFRGLRWIFRIIPMPAGSRDRLRQRFLERHAALIPSGPRGRPTSAVALRPYDHAAHRMLGFAMREENPLPEQLPATIVAFYLPQFHSIPENDTWWGAGFTEWRNVARALPQFEGHAQPRLPGDLGYYDLRLPDVMREQMKMARQYGVGAFCTYFYWFAGKTLLEAPLKQWLSDPSLGLPICLCWANENWTRRWDGRGDEVLIGQAHSPQDDLAFIEYIAPYLRDPRYLRVEGKPMLLVYRPGLLPEPRATAERWRDWCRNHDIGDIHLAYVQSFDNVAPVDIGFDAAVAFPPNNVGLQPITHEYRLVNPDFAGDIYDWRQLAEGAIAAKDPPYRLYPCVNPGWDNEPRRSARGRSFVRATPRAFGKWVRSAIVTARRRSPNAPLVFVNAWNEWAEGAVLEPDMARGYAWLDAVRTALLPTAPANKGPCAVVHLWRMEHLREIAAALRGIGPIRRTILVVPPDGEEAARREIARLSLGAEIFVASNRGGDALPFLRVGGKLLNEGENVVLRLRIGQMPALDQLATSQEAETIVRAFESDPTLGIVTTAGTVPPARPDGDAAAAHLEYLCALIGVPFPPGGAPACVADGAFWCRLSALAPLLDAPLTEAEFTANAEPSGDPMARAVERMVGPVALHGGFHLASAAQLTHRP